MGSLGDDSINGGLGSVAQEEENMAAWLVAVNTLKIQPFKLPPLGPHDVRIKIKAVGICGSDVHYLKTLRCANFVVEEPMVIGHECAGIVEEIGSEVKHLALGDRVAIEPGISCWRCSYCKQGSYNLCPEMKFFATPPVHGSLANQVVHPADLCFKLPDNVTLEEGAMCEPLSVGVHACRRANIGPETNVLIMGAGPIGLVALLSARAFGSPNVVIVDVDEHRLSVAKDLGANEVVKVSTNVNDVGAEVELIHKAMGGEGSVHITLDCAGFEKTMTTALRATRPGGKVCLVGMGHNDMTVPLTPAAAREVDVVGVFRYKNTWPLCIEFLSSGKIDVKPLITHRFGFSQKEVEDGFETSARGGSAIKEPVSVALAAPILDIQFHGWISFFILVYYSLPVMPNQKTYYEYTGLWHIYGFMSMNIWLWCAVFLTRDVEFTEKLYCSSYVAWLGFTLILSTLRAFDIRDRAARIMIALLVISFVATHILYLNFYSFDKGLNTKVNTLMITVQMLIWVIWVGLSRHPSRWSSNVARGSHSSWVFVVEFCKGPLLKDDAMFRTSSQLKEAK